MRYVKLKKEKILEFLECLQTFGTIHAPVKISEKFYNFRKIDGVDYSLEDIVFNYVRTVSPPKKYFHPPKEIMFTFDKEKQELYDAYVDYGPFVVFGVHPCDIVALRMIDSQFIHDDDPDSYYQRRRKDGLIIGISCMPDDNCFCNVRRTDFVDSGFDLFLHEVADGYLFRVGSVKGHKIIDQNERLFEKVQDEDVVSLTLFEQKRQTRFTMKGNWDNIKYILELRYNNELWDRESELCLGCGNCTLTCPTCRCYEVQDFPALDGKTGERVRFWDSCQFRSHGLVAGPHNFRETKKQRFINRYMCKNSFCEEVGASYCVGCGRCTYYCPAGISYLKNLMEIKGET